MAKATMRTIAEQAAQQAMQEQEYYSFTPADVMHALTVAPLRQLVSAYESLINLWLMHFETASAILGIGPTSSKTPEEQAALFERVIDTCPVVTFIHEGNTKMAFDFSKAKASMVRGELRLTIFDWLPSASASAEASKTNMASGHMEYEGAVSGYGCTMRASDLLQPGVQPSDAISQLKQALAKAREGREDEQA